MKTTEKIVESIKNDKNLSKKIESISYYNIENFIRDAIRYIRAIKDHRMICSIGSVSSSGMSRTIKFTAPEKSKNYGYNYQNFWSLFKALDYTAIKQSDYFRIGGCSMDMIFHTNYTNIHKLYRLGFMSKKECDILCQQTPVVI